MAMSPCAAVALKVRRPVAILRPYSFSINAKRRGRYATVADRPGRHAIRRFRLLALRPAIAVT